jgi:ketosteroid isomerase-like protein
MTSETAAALEREVLGADARRVQALLSNDYEALEDLLADDLTYVHSNGNLDTKDTYIGALRSGATRYLSMVMSGLSVRTDGNTAVVAGSFEARVQTGNGEVNPKPRVLIVYVKRDGRWQMLAWQSTNIAVA